MLEFLMNNLGTIIVAAVVLAILALVTIGMISDRKRGRSSCGGACGGCPNAGLCHAKQSGEHKC